MTWYCQIQNAEHGGYPCEISDEQMKEYHRQKFWPSCRHFSMGRGNKVNWDKSIWTLEKHLRQCEEYNKHMEDNGYWPKRHVAQ